MLAATPFFSDRGAHLRIYSEMKYLVRAGYDVKLVTYHLGYNPEGIDEKSIIRTPNIPWYTKTSPGGSFHKIYIDFLFLLKAVKTNFQCKPDYIHAHMYEALTAAAFIKIITFGKAKILFDCQGSLTAEMQSYTLNKKSYLKIFVPVFWILEKLHLLFPDHIACSSVNAMNALKDTFHVNERKLSLLRDGIDLDMLIPLSPQEKERLLREQNIPSGNTVIVYSGGMSKAKGVDALLDAIPNLLSHMPNTTFLFLGYGDKVLEDTYRERLKEYIRSGQVVIYGRVSYFLLWKFLLASDYAIDPKKDTSEASGKLINYVAAGLPVICFDNQFNRSVLKDSGLYINSFEDIYGTILERAIVGLTAQEIEEMSWENIIKSSLKPIYAV